MTPRCAFIAPLGLPGGARGVDDVREALEREAVARGIVGAARPAIGSPLGVDADHHRGVRGQRPREARLGEDHRRPGVGEHEGQALASGYSGSSGT